MKIYNLGNDYACQQKLKKEAETEQPHQLIVQPETKPTDNVENQLQAGGETTVATVNNETGPGEKDPGGETKKTSRKKKKEKIEADQQSPEC